MKRSLLLSLLLLFVVSSLSAQFIDRGPVVGAVSDNSAKIYIRTTTAQNYSIHLSTDSTFASFDSVAASSSAATYNTSITELTGLDPKTQYYYRFSFNGVVDSLQGRFRSFPTEGDKGYHKIVIVSCNYFYNAGTYTGIRAFDPDLLLHTGDWVYPPAQLGSNYNLNDSLQAESFAIRFDEDAMQEFVLPFTPIDYTYDDDYSNNNGEGNTYPSEYVTTDGSGAVVNVFETVQMDTGIVPGAIHAYQHYFPSYDLVDSTQGIYHNYKLGNVEIFMSDVRMSKDPKFDAFVYDSAQGKWTFDPPAGHSMLGEAQRDWLTTGLVNSDADWKLVGTGVVFNQRYKQVLDLGLALQQLEVSIGGVQGSGGILAAQMAYNWVGYPEDANALLDLYNSGQIDDVLMMSGDSHSSVMDDGTNAGLPEINSSGLAAGDEGYLNYYIDSVGQSLGFPAAIDSFWNGGGNGVANANFSDTYGTIEIFGDDSMKVCVVDEMHQTLGCINYIHSSKRPDTGIKTVISRPDDIMRLLYPNPVKDRLRLILNPDYQVNSTDKLEVLDINGSVVKSYTASQLGAGELIIPLHDLSSGTYLVNYRSKERVTETRQVIVQQ